MQLILMSSSYCVFVIQIYSYATTVMLLAKYFTLQSPKRQIMLRSTTLKSVKLFLLLAPYIPR